MTSQTTASPYVVRGALLLVILGIITLVLAMFIAPAGHLSVDEGVYHLMAREFARSGSLSIWNGYGEYPSPELVLQVVRVHEGQLAPQYPYLYAVIAAPFYHLAGYRGLFVCNALAYIGVVAFTFLIAIFFTLIIVIKVEIAKKIAGKRRKSFLIIEIGGAGKCVERIAGPPLQVVAPVFHHRRG